MDLKPAEKLLLGPEKVEWVESRCLCPTCPAFPKEDAGVKKAYCLRGDSSHKDKIDPSDCFCESCEVYKHGRHYGSNFFCLMGASLAKGFRNLLQGDPVSDLAEQRENVAPVLFVSAGLDVHKRHSEDRHSEG